MATKHPSNFYSYKCVPATFRSMAQSPDGKTGALEQQIQTHLTRGHQYFFQSRYQDALGEYQTAYALIHGFLHPDFPHRIGALQPSLLQGLNILDSLLAASGEIARYRQVAGISQPIVAPVEPPAEITAIVKKFGPVGTVEPLPPAQNYYRLATNYLQMGAINQAQSFLRKATEANNGQDRRLEADLNTATGVVLMRQQSPQQAQTAFARAQQLYSGLRLHSELAVVNNNLGVLHSLAGNAEAAGMAFQAAADHLPVDLGRTMIQPLNQGTASTMVRPMGSEGLGLILRSPDSESSWITVPSGAVAAVGAERLGVLVGKEVIMVNLQANPAAELRQKIYQPRVTANTLEALQTYEDLPFNFVSYLAHILGFTLPMSIGDCYFEMGEFDQALEWYQQAHDYPYLNQLIEAPTIWNKMAKAYLQWGHFFHNNGYKAEARVRYEKIVRLTAPILDPASALYLSPVFDGIKAQVEAILAAPQPLDVNVHNPAIASVIFLAQLNLQNIEAGIDLPLLSLEHEQVPVFTFEYLQNVARYFAEHAVQAERTYINFALKNSAEQEEFTRSMLENAVDLETDNQMLEKKKWSIATAQREVLDANLDYATLQRDNTLTEIDEYAALGAKQVHIDGGMALLAHLSMPVAGVEAAKLAEERRQLSLEFELANMHRRLSELQLAGKVAFEQQEVAVLQEQAAKKQYLIANLRRQQAEQQLELFDSQEFTPDLWNHLANEIKAISKDYVTSAIVIAQIMEQAFEFEIGETVDIIKSGYTRNDLSGLLAGDFLLRDIDSFTVLRIIHGEKKQPMKEVISLADRYPVQFLREFQRTGQMNFRTELSDFDRNYPGSYQQRITRVEIVVEGLIGRGGIHGTLTNSGLCLTRLRNGDIKMRLLKPETLLLSSHHIGPDSVVFTPDREMLAIFENSPVSTSWVLELRPSVNDVIYNFITDVKLIFYYEAFFDADLKPLVLEELVETQITSGRRAVAIRYEMFDEFFAFQDSGEVRFTLRDTMLPLYHTDPLIRDLTILLETDESVSSVGFVVQVAAADGASAMQTTDADGAIATGTGAALNAFVDRPWLQEWTIAIPQAPNQARFDAGFQWSQVRNIVFVTEYEFTPRRIPGEPYLLLRDRFDQDPLAAFDVSDDAQATQSAPSNWVYNPAEGRIEQTSNIHGGLVDTGPVKPGTYLVRKTDAALPSVQDFILTCRARSEDDDGIGLVFRWQDVDNFYFFLMDSQHTYRRIGKKAGGVFQELSTSAIDVTKGYIVGQTYSLKVRTKGQSLQVYLDGDLILAGQDASLPDAGRVGFLSWANTSAQFDDLQVIEI